MKIRLYLTSAALSAISVSALGQVAPPPGGMLATMPHGTYQCALPGDAAGDAYNVVDEEQFTIHAASGYSNALGSGSYILRGKQLSFTRGPKKGERFHRMGTNQLQRIEADGAHGQLICTRLRTRG